MMLKSPGGVFMPALGKRRSAAASGLLDGYTTGLTAAFSMSRQLLSSYGGAFYADTAGAITALNDQSGNARHMTNSSAADEPALDTAGANSRACATFALGSTDFLAGAAASNFLSLTAFYGAVSVYVTDLEAGGDAYYNQNLLISDEDAYFAISDGLDAATETNPVLRLSGWDGSQNDAEAPQPSVPATYVLEFWLESEQLNFRIDGGTTYTAAITTGVEDLSSALKFGSSYGSGDNAMGAKIFEAVLYNAVPSSGDRTAIAGILSDWVN